MNVYTKSLKTLFGTDSIEQVGSKSMAVLNGNLLISYETIIGVKLGSKWFVTGKKYSPTTSKHSTQFCNGKECERVGEEVFRDMLSAALVFKNDATSIDEGKLQNFVNSMSVSE